MNRSTFGKCVSGAAMLVACCGLAQVAQAQIQWKATPGQTYVIPKQVNLKASLQGLGVEGHGVVQLTRPITDTGREFLGALGLEILSPVGNNAFICQVHGEPDYRGLELSGWITGVVNIDPNWKVDPKFRLDDVLSLWGDSARAANQAAGSNAAAADDPMVAVYVHLHDNLAADLNTQAMVSQYLTKVVGALESIPVFVGEMRLSDVDKLALEQDVMYISPAIPLLTPNNAENRVLTGVDTANAAPYSLNGAGVKVFVFDAGDATASHPGFGGRLTVIDTAGPVTHSSHCAGTVGGNGANSSNNMHRGMAPGCTMLSAGINISGIQGWMYNNPCDIEGDYTNAYSQGAHLATNSIGTNVTSNGFSCAWLGDYNTTDILIDRMVRGSLAVTQNNPFRIVWAAGNERQSSSCDSATAFPYYYVAPPAGAKNQLCIGAVNSNDDSMTSFSTWGPTEDGRMKPDFCAPGCQVGGDGGVTSTDGGTGYTTMCGTSMATPTVAGMTALLLQDFRAHYPIADDPRNSTLKAIYATTAVDRGRVGPDYEFGYGSVRIVPALELVRDGRFDEFEASQDQIQTFTVTIPEGQTRFAATIAWDDAPGTALVNPVLVNNIDIVVEGPTGSLFHPWTLNPAVPNENAARTGPNTRDNIEQVQIDNPVAGTYTIRVSGTNVPVGPQPVSIAATHGITFSGSVPLVRLESVQLADTLVAPTAPPVVVLRTRVFQDTLVAGSVVVKYSADGNAGPFISIPMTQRPDLNWQATLPTPICGNHPTYYFQAAGQTVGTVTLPTTGATDAWDYSVGQWQTFFTDDCETVTGGWSFAAPGDNATWGGWSYGDPSGYGSPSLLQPEDDATSGTGTRCMGTDPRPITQVPASFNDVDGGTTTLVSRVFNLAGRTEPRMTMKLWYVNGVGAQARNDSMPIQYSYNNGTTWATLDDVGAGGAAFNGGWATRTYILPGTPTATTRFKFPARDLGAENVVEVFVDDFSFDEIVCTDVPATCDGIDFNNDTSLFDPQDIDAFLSVYGEGPCIPNTATCNDIDFNNDTSVFDPCDIDSFLTVFAEGPCTPCGQ
ncbi:MAG: S8 family serine peptidase [Phycisphaerales bacterium]